MKVADNTPEAVPLQAPSTIYYETNSITKVLKRSSFLTIAWSFIVLLLNLWTLFSTILWISVKNYYDSVTSLLEVLVESLLFFEILARIVVKILSQNGYDNLNLYHARRKDKIWTLLILLVGSCPVYTIYTGLHEETNIAPEHATIVVRLLALKFLRAFEIVRTVVRVEEILFYKKFAGLVLVKFVKNCLYVLFITHLSTCCWLFLASDFSGHPLIIGTNPRNPFNRGDLYYERRNMTEASLLTKYADASVWAVGALTGCNFSEVTPITFEEMVVTIAILLVGIILLAKIFSDFASLRYVIDMENIETKEKSIQAIKLCRLLNIPSDIKYKIQTYYALENQAFSYSITTFLCFLLTFNVNIRHFSSIKELPNTLQTDIMLSLNRDFISKINLFNFGPPDFVFMVVRHLYPQISMPGDFVVRVGEYANEMFFIKQGEVEIIATDDKTIIGVLSAGAYFGEVGLLLKQKRTVSIRALTICHFGVINRDDFNRILDIYPQQRDFLLRVAIQRAKICTYEDLNPDNPLSPSNNKSARGHTLVDINITSNRDEDHVLLNSPRKTKVPTRSRRFKLSTVSTMVISSFKDTACVGKGIDFRAIFLILPTSKYIDQIESLLIVNRFHQFWTLIIGLAVFANQFLVPFEIAFLGEYDSISTSLLYLDVVLVVIYFLDIFVNMNTSIREKGLFVSDKQYIQKKYISEQFAIDFIAFLPINYIIMGLHLPASYAKWIKLLRFLKVLRCIQLFRYLQEQGRKQKRFLALVMLMVFFICLNNLAACIMYMIAVTQNDSVQLTMLKSISSINGLDIPLISQPSFIRFIYFQYWAWSLSSSGAYGDIVGVTPAEKLFEVVAMLFFRIFFAFYAAEVSAVISSSYLRNTQNIGKKVTYDKWMKHNKLPEEIIERVTKYNECIWTKYRGINENQILDDIPKSTRQEILEYLLLNMLETTEIFPNDEVGLFSNVIKDFKFIVVTKDEFIFKAGETVDEIFFIIEGEVVILNQSGRKAIGHLKKNDFFGETAIIDDKTGIRTENARAKTDVSLGVLHLSSIRSLWRKYPNLKEKMNRIAQMRLENYKKQGIDTIQEVGNYGLKTSLTKRESGKKEITGIPTELEPVKITKELETVPEGPDSRRSFLPESQNINIKPPVTSLFKAKIDIGEDTKRMDYNGPLKEKKSLELVQHSTYAIPSKLETEPNGEKHIQWHLTSSPDQPKESEGDNFSEIIDEEVGNDKDGQSSHKRADTSNNFPINSKKDDDKPKEIVKLKSSPSAQFRAYLVSLRGKVTTLRVLVLTVAVLFEWFYRPLNVALDVTDFNSPLIILLEVVLIILFVWDFVMDLTNPFIGRKTRYEMGSSLAKKKPSFGDIEIRYRDITIKPVTIMANILFICPFQMLFGIMGIEIRATNVFMILLQFSRLFAFNKLSRVFQFNFFKKRYALTNILITLTAFFYLNHLFACLFTLLANAQDDFNTTWLAKVPAPKTTFPSVRPALTENNFTIYIHALYWSYVTTSHVGKSSIDILFYYDTQGVGDITPMNHGERVYVTIVIMLTTFLYAILFGNLASMVDDLTPKFQKEYEANYSKVVEYIKSSKLEAFADKIHSYYSYLWRNTKGIDENMILKGLPNSLKYDIFLLRYNNVLTNSKFFKNESGVIDHSIFYSFCKKFRYGIFMKNDFIITVGQEVNDIYIILEGGAEYITNKIMVQPVQLYPGDYFGGIFAGITQIKNVVATGITKVAILPQADFFQMKEAFPDWYQNIIKDDKMHKIAEKFLGNLRSRLERKKSGFVPSLINKPLTKEKIFQNVIDIKPIKGVIHLNQVKMKNEDQSFSEESESESQSSKELSILQKNSMTPENVVGGEPKYEAFGSLVPSSQQSQKEKDSSSSEKFEIPNERVEAYDHPPKNPGDNQADLDVSGMDSKTVVTKSSMKTSDKKHRSNRPSLFKKHANEKSGSPDPSSPCEDPAVEAALKIAQIEMPRLKKKGLSLPPQQARPSSLPASEPSSKKVLKDTIDLQKRRRSEYLMKSLGIWNKKASIVKREARRLSSFLLVPSFLIQEDESGERSPSRQNSRRNKFLRRITLKKSTSFMQKSLADKFVNIIVLRRKLTEQFQDLKYYIDPNSGWRTLYELVHTLVIIYSLFAVPLYVGLNMQFGLASKIIESLICAEQILYIILLTRTAQLAYGVLTLDSSIIWAKLWRKGILTELLAIIPFNLIFGLLDIKEPLLVIGILRMNRLLLIGKLPLKLNIFSTKYPKLAKYMGIIKPTFYLAFGSHFAACLFGFLLLLEPKEQFETNFLDFLELNEALTVRKYVVCLSFFLSIATTTGYPELIIYNNYERIVFVVFVYLGDALFATILGWFAANSGVLPQKYLPIFHHIRNLDSILDHENVPQKVRNKVISYFAYLAETGKQNNSCLKALSGLLPQTMLKEMTSMQTDMFQNFSLFKEFRSNKPLINEIVANLKHNIYFPRDYIVIRNDFGAEAYLIAEGTVHILFPGSDKKVMAVLKAGDSFGELGLCTTTKRLVSLVAVTFCVVYTLEKNVLRNILKAFPHANFDFKLFAKEKLDDYSKGSSNDIESRLTHNYSTMRVANLKREVSKEEAVNLLKSCEIPRFMLYSKQRNAAAAVNERKTTKASFFDYKNPKIVIDDTISAVDLSIGEIVEEDEIKQRDIDDKKTSFRVNVNKRERRFSRMKIVKEKSVAKSAGVTVTWGITLN